MTAAAFALPAIAPAPKLQPLMDAPPRLEGGNDFGAQVAASREAQSKIAAKPKWERPNARDANDVTDAKDLSEAKDARDSEEAKDSKEIKNFEATRQARAEAKNDETEASRPDATSEKLDTSEATKTDEGESAEVTVEGEAGTNAALPNAAPMGETVKDLGEAVGRVVPMQQDTRSDDAAPQIAAAPAPGATVAAPSDDPAPEGKPAAPAPVAQSAAETRAQWEEGAAPLSPPDAGDTLELLASQASAPVEAAQAGLTAAATRDQAAASIPEKDVKAQPKTAAPSEAARKAGSEQAASNPDSVSTTAKPGPDLAQVLGSPSGRDAPSAPPPATSAPSSSSAPPATSPAFAATLATATQATNGATTIRAQMNGSRVTVPAEAIAFEIRRHQAAGVDRFQIRLEPPELGRIDVKIELAHDGTTRAHLSADRQETLDLLQRDSRALERALSGVGLKTDRENLNFSLRQDGAPGREAGSDRGGTGTSSPSLDEDMSEMAPPIRASILDPTRIDILI